MSSDDFELEFVYNDEGIRTQKIVNDSEIHTYHLSGTDIIAEEWGSNLIVYLYDSDGSPMGMQYRRNSMDVGEFYTFWFEKNLQGDIVAVYNSAGIKVISYSYDAWGNCITKHHNLTGTNSYATYNPFRYRGYYFDSELGFYYLNSRYYNPEWGRFINADIYVSTGQGLLGYNMFAYCGNNPISYCDPTGSKYSNAQIHNFVVEDVCNQSIYLTYKKTFIKYKTQYKWHWYGFCDIVNTSTGEIWEVKRYGGGPTCKMDKATEQLNNYVNNGQLVWRSNLNERLQVGGTQTTIFANEFSKTDNDGLGYYIISYWYEDNGIIYYDYCYYPSVLEVAAVGGAVIVAAAQSCANFLNNMIGSRLLTQKNA